MINDCGDGQTARAGVLVGVVGAGTRQDRVEVEGQARVRSGDRERSVALCETVKIFAGKLSAGEVSQLPGAGRQSSDRTTACAAACTRLLLPDRVRPR